MTLQSIAVQTPRGAMPVHLAGPDEAPLIVIFMDAPGVRPTLHDHAQRLVDAGFRTALPDLYYAFDPADLPDVAKLTARDPQEFARMGAVVGRLKDDEIVDDTALMLDALGGDATRSWGCLGFCFGGRVGMRCAARFGSALAAAALLHPSRLVTDEPDSPHRRLDGVGASLYLGFGAEDDVTPPSVIPVLEHELDAHGIRHTAEVLPGAGHGFTMRDLPSFNAPAAQQAMEGAVALFQSQL